MQEVFGHSCDVLIEGLGGIVQWSQESNYNNLSKKGIKVHDLVAQPRVTSKILEDSAVGVERVMSNKIGESFARAEDGAF